ncbi:zinc finger protein 267-like isoform X2 [Cotesia glomerata]|uniref:zinc finger protein 267-like isoform X2 n=1 Tax=Cotesia glomerata TaxID=32391 RepID=UPI001D0126BD|nr:zinc finger protein 267-like isoform X2 [Cotesia glomerata]
MVNFKANILSNIPKRYLPIVLLKKLQISTINNPTFLCSPVTKSKLQKSLAKNVYRVEIKDQNNNQGQLDEYNLDKEDIIPTCFNSETEFRRHDIEVLSTHDHDLKIISENCQENDNCENFSGQVLESDHYCPAKTRQVEVEVYSPGFSSEKQELFSDEQIFEKVPQITSFSNVENDELQTEESEVDVEGLSESDEESSSSIRTENFNKSLYENELKVLDLTSDSSMSNDESSAKYQPPEIANTINEHNDHGNTIDEDNDRGNTIDEHNDRDYISKFLKDHNQVKNQVISKYKRKKQLKKCPECDFVTMWNLRRHMVRHSSDRPYKCSDCNYSSKTKCTLKIHIRSHSDEKNFKCSVCPYRSQFLPNLQRHIRIHTGFRPYKCSQCFFASAYLENLKRHSFTHTGIRPFKCSVCSFGSITYHGLRVHSKTHNTVKSFKCTQCLYATTTKDNLMRHSRRHLRTKSYKCSHCLFATKTLRIFKQHLRTHEEKDSTDTNTNKSEIQLKSLNNTTKQCYSCYDCKMSFKRKTSLEKHWKLHHYSQIQKDNNYHCSL